MIYQLTLFLIIILLTESVPHGIVASYKQNIDQIRLITALNSVKNTEKEMIKAVQLTSENQGRMIQETSLGQAKMLEEMKKIEQVISTSNQQLNAMIQSEPQKVDNLLNSIKVAVKENIDQLSQNLKSTNDQLVKTTKDHLITPFNSMITKMIKRGNQVPTPKQLDNSPVQTNGDHVVNCQNRIRGMGQTESILIMNSMIVQNRESVPDYEGQVTYIVRTYQMLYDISDSCGVSTTRLEANRQIPPIRWRPTGATYSEDALTTVSASYSRKSLTSYLRKMKDDLNLLLSRSKKSRVDRAWIDTNGNDPYWAEINTECVSKGVDLFIGRLATEIGSKAQAIESFTKSLSILGAMNLALSIASGPLGIGVAMGATLMSAGISKILTLELDFTTTSYELLKTQALSIKSLSDEMPKLISEIEDAELRATDEQKMDLRNLKEIMKPEVQMSYSLTNLKISLSNVIDFIMDDNNFNNLYWNCCKKVKCGPLASLASAKTDVVSQDVDMKDLANSIASLGVVKLI